MVMFKMKKARVRPNLYCLPFPVMEYDTDVAVLGTNAFNYESVQKQPISLYRFDSNIQYVKSSFVMQYEPQTNNFPYVEMENSQKCMDRRAFDRTIMHFVVKSNQTVNRYE